MFFANYKLFLWPQCNGRWYTRGQKVHTVTIWYPNVPVCIVGRIIRWRVLLKAPHDACEDYYMYILLVSLMTTLFSGWHWQRTVPDLPTNYIKSVKGHIFWEGHKILQNLHLTFVFMYCRQKVRISQNFVAFAEYTNFMSLAIQNN